MRISCLWSLAVLAACSGGPVGGGDDAPDGGGGSGDGGGGGSGSACEVTAGVAMQAAELELPEGYSRFLGVNWQGALCSGSNVPEHTVMDLTGDGYPDLVVTERCGDEMVGRAHWLVYPGTATGFGAAVQFALPPEYSRLIGVAWGERLCDGSNIPAHAVIDMTGDGKPDLVVTDRCNDTSIDRTHWLVYANSGTGFAATPAQFALPAGYSRFIGVAWTGGALCTNGNVPEHVMMDMTDDGLPDLLVTDRCNDTEIARTRWLMYPGSTSGFGAATELALPAEYTRLVGAAWTGGPLCNGTNIPEHVLMDLRGDDRPDLVVIGRCNDAAVSRDHWLVYTADATGFAATPAQYALPDGYDRFLGVAWQGPLCTNGNVPEHVTMDVDADGRPDVLVTDRCNDASISRDHWLVYKGGEAGFAAAPTTFALPAGYDRFLGAAWDGALCDGRNIPEHVMLDANADGRPDLLVTDRCGDDAIDRTHWLVYTNQCAP